MSGIRRTNWYPLTRHRSPDPTSIPCRRRRHGTARRDVGATRDDATIRCGEWPMASLAVSHAAIERREHGPSRLDEQRAPTKRREGIGLDSVDGRPLPTAIFVIGSPTRIMAADKAGSE